MQAMAFGESTMSRKKIQKLNCGITGLENVIDDNRPSRPSRSKTDENIKAGKKMILDNRRITIREFADDRGISLGSCQAIFTDFLVMKCAAVKIVPKLLNFDQKTLRGHCSGHVDDFQQRSRGTQKWP